MKTMKKQIILTLTLFMLPILVKGQNHPVLDIMHTNYEYPFKVDFFNFNNQQQDLIMAYMDIQPKGSNGKVVVLIHGKNFNGAYWKTIIEALTNE